jgi:hypothetical protein
MPRWIFKGRDRLTHRAAEQLDREARELDRMLANRPLVIHAMRIRQAESRAA